MTDPSLKTVVLQLNETDQLGPITVDSANYEMFEDEVDERLSKLVDAWKHLAAPNANRIRRNVMKP